MSQMLKAGHYLRLRWLEGCRESRTGTKESNVRLTPQSLLGRCTSRRICLKEGNGTKERRAAYHVKQQQLVDLWNHKVAPLRLYQAEY